MARPTREIAGLAVGIGTLLGTATLARRPITHAEMQTFRTANGLPGEWYPAIWIPMQYGTFGTVPAVAVLALVRHRPRLALAIVVGGSAAWVSAKALKLIVDRGRPASIIEGVTLRGVEEGDRGSLRARRGLRSPDGHRSAVRGGGLGGVARGPLRLRALRAVVCGSPPPARCGRRFRTRSGDRQRRQPAHPAAVGPRDLRCGSIGSVT